MELARTESSLPDRASLRSLARIEEWAVTTRTGDLAELLKREHLADATIIADPDTALLEEIARLIETSAEA